MINFMNFLAEFQQESGFDQGFRFLFKMVVLGIELCVVTVYFLDRITSGLLFRVRLWAKDFILDQYTPFDLISGGRVDLFVFEFTCFLYFSIDYG